MLPTTTARSVKRWDPATTYSDGVADRLQARGADGVLTYFAKRVAYNDYMTGHCSANYVLSLRKGNIANSKDVALTDYLSLAG
jgi:hypothetical protein